MIEPAIDFAALSTSMGVPHERVLDREGVLAAAARAVARGGPSVIEVTLK
jgi:thiamine pyrophosphate-dependent acetolactate synthase large subunit-like protein